MSHDPIIANLSFRSHVWREIIGRLYSLC